MSADLTVFVDGQQVTALVDTGADFSIMSQNLAIRLKKVKTPWTGPLIRTAGGQLLMPVGRCTARIGIEDSSFVATFIVLSTCCKDLIIGMDFLREHGAVISIPDRVVSFQQSPDFNDYLPPQRNSLRLSDDDVVVPPMSCALVSVVCDVPFDGEGVADQIRSLLFTHGISVARGIVSVTAGRTNLLLTNFSAERRRLPKGTAVAYLDDIADVGEASLSVLDEAPKPSSVPVLDVSNTLPQDERKRLLELLAEFQDCFASASKVGRTPLTQHRIITEDTARPIRQNPYRVAAKEREAIQQQVAKMLEDDVIQPSKSPWSSPVVLVKKKDGSLRFCVDYRKLNQVTKKDVYPLPRIDDSLDRLRNARYFSSMDLKSGYWQIEVDPRDREKTAFVTPDGLYEFKVLPFGLCSAPATFQRLMDTVLSGLKWKTCLVYLDDVIVFSATFHEHLERLKAVLQAIRFAGLTLKPEKCHFCFQELQFLGHVVSQAGVRPDPDKVAAVANFPVPTDKKAVRRFLGLCSYYRRFIADFARIASPLTQLTRDDVAFVWNNEQETAFNDLRQRLQTPPVLAHFDETAPTMLHTDASNVGLGAVLVQWQDHTERVIAYASRTLTRAEANYSTTEKECLAVVWAIMKFRPYLYGRPFKVISDHHSLCWLTRLKDPNGRLARWSLRLQEYDLTVVHKSGKRHTDADCLSRSPIESAALPDDDETAFLGVLDMSAIAQQQREDPELLELIHYLKGKSPKAPKIFARLLSSFCLRSEVLYKRNFSSIGATYLLVVPTALRPEVLRACHNEATSGHLGYTRTLARVQQRYYWPRLNAAVKHHVRACLDCQRRKSPPTKPAGLLQPVQVPRTPFDQIGMDILGPLPTSTAGNRWVIVATDYLTRYAETKAIPRGTAAEVAQFFIENIVLRHGAPTIVITDRGTAFTAALLDHVLALSGTAHRKTTAYHPQTNGLTERLNKTLEDMLSMYVDVEHKNWDEILPYVTFAYNTAKQETTRMTPFSLVHGREVRTMLDAMLPHECDDSATDADIFTQRAEEARQLARLRIHQQQDYDAGRYNAHRRVVTFETGDRVWVWTPIRKRGLSEKLLRRYFGPYRVLRRISDVTYEVVPDSPHSTRRQQHRPELVHVVRMKPYVGE